MAKRTRSRRVTISDANGKTVFIAAMAIHLTQEQILERVQASVNSGKYPEITGSYNVTIEPATRNGEILHRLTKEGVNDAD